MIIRCTFSVPFERIRDYAGEVSELSSLPNYIIKRGPYIGGAAGAGPKIIITYDFERARLVEAWEAISKQFDRFHRIPGFALSAHILEKDKEVKRYPLGLTGKEVTDGDKVPGGGITEKRAPLRIFEEF